MQFRYFLFLFIITGFSSGTNFMQEQLKNYRVKEAYTEKWKKLSEKIGNDTSGFEIFIRGFKQEGYLEVWIKGRSNSAFRLFDTYKICASSGIAGPKRKSGDLQVPEGFYKISVFNPYSNYHLSLGISYPNQSDKIIGKKSLGGDIMIHGNCVTIGCIPITDDKIKELYLLAVSASSNGQKEIPVYLFPVRLEEKEFQKLIKDHSAETELCSFWKNIKIGYDYFEKNKMLPVISVDKNGKYLIGK